MARRGVHDCCNRGHWGDCTVERGSTAPHDACYSATTCRFAEWEPIRAARRAMRNGGSVLAHACGRMEWNGPRREIYGTEHLQVAAALACHGARHAAGPAGRRHIQPCQGPGPAQRWTRVCGAGRGAPQGAGAGVDQRRHEGVPRNPDARPDAGRAWRAAFRPVDRHPELGRRARAELRRLRPHRHDRRIRGGRRHGVAHRLHGGPRRVPRRQAPARRAARRLLDRRMPCAAPCGKDGGLGLGAHQRTVPRHDEQAAARRARRDHLARHHEQRPCLGLRTLRRPPACGGGRRADPPDRRRAPAQRDSVGIDRHVLDALR